MRCFPQKAFTLIWILPALALLGILINAICQNIQIQQKARLQYIQQSQVQNSFQQILYFFKTVLNEELNSAQLASTTARSYPTSAAHSDIYIAKPNESADPLILSSDYLNLDLFGLIPSASEPLISTDTEEPLSTSFLWLLPDAECNAWQEGIAFAAIPYDTISPTSQDLPVCHLRQQNGSTALKQDLTNALNAPDTPPYLKEALSSHMSETPLLTPPFQTTLTHLSSRSQAPVLTEFALFAGIAGDKEDLESSSLPQSIPIYLNLYSLIEIWNPSGIQLRHDPDAQEFRVTLTGLSSIEGLSLDLPETLSLDYNLWTTLQAGAVQTLASPTTNGGSINTGVWQFYLGDALIKEPYPSLDIQTHEIQIELKMKSDEGWITLHKMSLKGLSHIERHHSAQTPFLRNLSSNGKQGMGRISLQQSDYSWSIHYKMNDAWTENAGLPHWFKTQDFRNIIHQTSYQAPLSNPYWILSTTEPYKDLETFSDQDFFVYNPYDKRNRRYARIYDLLSQSPKTYAELRASFSPDVHWQALGESYGGTLNEIFDRYSFDLNNSNEDSSELSLAYSFNGLNLNRHESYLQDYQANENVENFHFYDHNASLFCTQNLQSPLLNQPESYAYNWYTRYVSLLDEESLQAETLQTLYDDWQHPWTYQSHRDLAKIPQLENNLIQEMGSEAKIYHRAEDFINSGTLDTAIQSCGDPIPAYLPAGISQGKILSQLNKEYQTTDDMVLLCLYYERHLKEHPEIKTIYRAQCLFIRTLSPEKTFKWLPLQFVYQGKASD